MQNYANLQDNAAFACSEYLNLQDKVENLQKTYGSRIAKIEKNAEPVYE